MAHSDSVVPRQQIPMVALPIRTRRAILLSVVFEDGFPAVAAVHDGSPM
jgi:hypothetical protein